MHAAPDFCQLTIADTKRIKQTAQTFKIEERFLAKFLTDSHNAAFVAVCGSAVAGFLYGYRLNPPEGKPQFFVYSLDVAPSFQNKGIGTKLFQYVVDYSKAFGDSECFVITDKGNKAACRVYEKAGGKNDHDDEIVYVIQHG